MKRVENISVVIPASNERLLVYVLLSLSRQRDVIKEVIVVEDWTYEKDFGIKNLSAHFGCTYLRLATPKRNPFDFRAPECRNIGAQKASGDIVLWLDNDCVPCLWYGKRLLEIHNHFDSVYFCADRIKLHENANAIGKKWEHIIDKQWRKQRQIAFSPKNYKYFKAFWDNTKGYPFGAYTHNLSIRRELVKTVGEFKHFFGYGEEDTYWDYEAEKKSIRGIYQIEPSKDIYVCHVNHRPTAYGVEFAAINRLWLYETDPSFKSACYNIREDWAANMIEEIEARGLQILPFFDDLPELPQCLKKYVK